jgi:hypothetical protein
MIRIDEIYNHTFWPYIRKYIPNTRLFFCDPPGSTVPDSLKNFGLSKQDTNFIYCHDQEPIYSDIHQSLFDSVAIRNLDLNYTAGPVHSAIVVSELNSQPVKEVCDQYGWRQYYYFFHGWAALDWYRGYNRTCLMPPLDQRQIKYSFISPNRLIGGRRDHRVLLMYHLLKREISTGLISFPYQCPQEHVSVTDIARTYKDRYNDIIVKLKSANFPWNMPNETGHPMHSCWLSLFEENAASLVHVITETSYFGHKLHLTEKTFKPICLQMPFVLVSNAGSLRYLKKYGFRTFGDIWDESYDSELDDFIRLEKIADLLKSFDGMSTSMLQEIQQACRSIVQHNFNHFYNGGFERILWSEFSSMLTQLSQDFNQ